MIIEVDPRAEALIFDLDGTLSDSLPVHVLTWKMLGEQLGFNFNPQIVHELTGRPTVQFAKRIISDHNLNNISPLELAKLKQLAFIDNVHKIKPIPEVIDIVKKYCGKLPMAVGTGASRKSAELQLQALDLLEYFEAIVSADDVKHHKPHPETFLKCAEILGVEPSKCQVFEDGAPGIAAVKQAGMILTDVKDYIEYGDWVLT